MAPTVEGLDDAVLSLAGTTSTRAVARPVEMEPPIAGATGIQRRSFAPPRGGIVQMRRPAVPGPAAAGEATGRPSSILARPSPAAMAGGVSRFRTGGAGHSEPVSQTGSIGRLIHPVQRKSTATSVPEAELPLALPAVVVQRQADDQPEAARSHSAEVQAPSDKTKAAVPPGMEALFGMVSETAPAAREELDPEDGLVERVMRRLQSEWALESERHGGWRWPWKS
ncbi:MAG TPA: hypothetical protein VHN15_08110 [Thermoanaerobaculia bacterium]|nr:hypothetical protein [Thermoanaerobaculia bacterium]